MKQGDHITRYYEGDEKRGSEQMMRAKQPMVEQVLFTVSHRTSIMLDSN
jgi:hypothetical protein